MTPLVMSLLVTLPLIISCVCGHVVPQSQQLLSHAAASKNVGNNVDFMRDFEASIEPFFAAVALSWTQAVQTNGQRPDKADLTLIIKQAMRKAPLKLDRSFLRQLDECDDCKAEVKRVQTILLSDAAKERLADLAKQLCRRFELFSDYICDGAVNIFTNVVLEIVAHSILEPLEVCGEQGICPYETTPTWNVTFPKPKPVLRNPPLFLPDAPRKYILHITDVHYDPAYTLGLEAQCGDPLCCRPPNPLGTTQPAGIFGEMSCDAPKRLVDDLYTFISTSPSLPKIDYIIWTGDITPHNIWEATKESYDAISGEMAAMLQKYFPGVPVYGSVGNHESPVIDNFAPLSITEPEFATKPLYETLSAQWAPWLSEEAQEQMKLGGSFEMLMEPGVRVVSVNDEGCSNNNWWLRMRKEGGCCKYEYADPDNTLHWLVQVLQAAEDVGERVFLLRHVSNSNRCNNEWSKNFFDIVLRYENTIVGLFHGHSHDDYFSIYYRDQAKTEPAVVSYIGPAVVPYSSGNPAFRIYEVDWDTIDVFNSYTYITNLTDSNVRGYTSWGLEYSSNEAYNMRASSAQQWHELTLRFERDQALFDEYYYYKLRSYTNGRTCTGTCKDNEICGMRTPLAGQSCNI